MLGKYPPTKSFNDRRVVRKSDYFSDDYSQYLCFLVYFGTNNLDFDRNSHVWSESQQEIHDQNKSLHDEGTGNKS